MGFFDGGYLLSVATIQVKRTTLTRLEGRDTYLGRWASMVVGVRGRAGFATSRLHAYISQENHSEEARKHHDSNEPTLKAFFFHSRASPVVPSPPSRETQSGCSSLNAVGN